MVQQLPKRWSDVGSDAPGAMRELLHAAREDLPTQVELRSMGLIGLAAPPGADVGSGVEGVGGPDAAAGPASKVSATLKAASSSSGTLPPIKLALLAKVSAGLVVAGGAIWLTNQPSSTPTDASVPPVNVNSLPTQSPAASPQHAVATGEAESPAPERAAPAAEPAGAPPAPRARPVRSAQLSEAALLQRAQSLLATQPARALALTEQHQREYPSGQLVQEREVIRIEALRRLGQAGKAEKVGRDFERQFPDSPHRRKLDQSDP